MPADTLVPDPTASTDATAALLARQREFLLPVQSRMLYYGDRPLAVARAQGDWLWDVEGHQIGRAHV